MSFNSTSKELIEQNINGLLSIHDSWLRISMDSVANITNGFAFKSSEFNNRKDGVPLIRIRDVLKVIHRLITRVKFLRDIGYIPKT